MKKFLVLSLAVILILGVTVFAQTVLDKDVEEFVKDVASIKGVDKNTIEGVKQVDFNDLPEEVNIKNIDETNLALYEVNVENEKPVYVITASSEMFKETVKKYTQRMLLNFGFSGEIVETNYLQTATGVTTGLEKGYVMSRDGSITSLSTNLEVTEKENSHPIQIIIYKNSQEVGFRNSFDVSKTGIYNDYDLISSGTLNFNKGDVISVKVLLPENTKIKDITTLMEVSTE